MCRGRTRVSREGESGVAACGINEAGLRGKIHTGKYWGGHSALAVADADRHRGV